MTGAVHRVYSIMPAPVREWMASAHGYQLRRWRYGEQTDALTEAALERERWPSARWRTWQEEQLSRMLDHAARNVPYYREQWSMRRARGDRASWERLEHWPWLEKEAVRKYGAALVADTACRSRLHRETTSGTTGMPVAFWLSQDATRGWYALAEARWRRWYGLSRNQRWALLGSQPVAPVGRKRPPYWVWNGPMQQLYLSAYHLFPAALGDYMNAISRYGVEYLWGHSSGLDTLAREALRIDRTDIRPKAVLSIAEPLRSSQRERIRAAFGCAVRETYGMSEMMAAASECEWGHLHLWPDVAWYETRPIHCSGQSVTELVSTGFLNPDMPLVRYCTGDLISIRQEDTQCRCGRTLPLLTSIEGRSSDVFHTADGRVIAPAALEAIFEADFPLLEGQVVQDSLNSFRIRYVPAQRFTPSVEQELRKRLRDRLGDVDIICESLPQIPREANGKFRAAICRSQTAPLDAKYVGATIPPSQ